MRKVEKLAKKLIRIDEDCYLDCVFYVTASLVSSKNYAQRKIVMGLSMKMDGIEVCVCGG